MSRQEAPIGITEDAFQNFTQTERYSLNTITTMEGILKTPIPKILYSSIFDIRLDCKTPQDFDIAAEKLIHLIRQRNEIIYPFSVTEKESTQPVRIWQFKGDHPTSKVVPNQKVYSKIVSSWQEDVDNIFSLHYKFAQPSEWGGISLNPSSVRLYRPKNHTGLLLAERPTTKNLPSRPAEIDTLVEFEKLVEAYRRGTAYAFPVGAYVNKSQPSESTNAYLLYATPADGIPMHTLDFRKWDQEARFNLINETLKQLKILHEANVAHGDTKLDNILWCPKQQERRVVFIDPKKMHFIDFEITQPQDQRAWDYALWGNISLFVSDGLDKQLIQGDEEFNRILSEANWVNFPDIIMNALKSQLPSKNRSPSPSERTLGKHNH